MDQLGPNFASGTLDVESQMVFIKTLLKSRRNLLEGFAALYPLQEQVFWWTLTEQDLEIPPAMRQDFTWKAGGKGHKMILDPRHQPLDAIWGHWKGENILPHVALEYLRDHVAAKEGTKKRKGKKGKVNTT